MEFISQHPELKEEFESFETITLKDVEGIKFEGKDALKKQHTGITASGFDEYAIAYVEGTLSPELQKELKNFIRQNPAFKKELELFTKTKLLPDTSIIFEEKHLLKRKGKRPVAFYYWSAAASVAIIIAAYFLLNKNGTPDTNNIVKHEQHKDTGMVVKQIVKPVDTTTSIPKSIANTSTINAVKNNIIGVKTPLNKQHKNRKGVPDNSTENSSVAKVVRRKNKIHALPYSPQNNIPVDTESYLTASAGNLNDTLFYSAANSPEKEYTIVEREDVKKRSRFLATIAAIACKGLHTITGQHIELEKKYDSDTTNIVAYQLDLGNKKYEFPVKE